MAARADLTRDPAILSALLVARRGQAFWARKLNELPDDQFDAPSKVPGWTRGHLIAHVGFRGRALARLVDALTTDGVPEAYPSDADHRDEVAFGATLPVDALRNLCAHSAVHLNVSWRDLPAAAWQRSVSVGSGRVIPVAETVSIRARDVWTHAIDLDNGASPRDIPTELLKGGEPACSSTHPS